MSLAERLSRVRSLHLILLPVLLVVAAPAFLATAEAQPAGRAAAAPGKTPSIEDKTAGMQKLDGYFPLYWDGQSGTLYMEISKFDTEVLYFEGLQAGVGSNDIGLDRGQGGGADIVKFERVGPKILMVQPNLRYRATSSNPDEVRAVEEAFATSTIWGFTVAAETGDRVLVDLTDFLLRDSHGIIQRLRPATYRLDKTRSAVYMPNTKNFPKNTEMEVTLTFTTDGSAAHAGGGFGRGSLQAVVPDTGAVTVRTHHSLIELPDSNYTPRVFDPRAGYSALTYEDYAAPLGEPMTKRFIRRHRLQKKDPTAKISDPVKPIIYYVDRGTPEPIRSALIEGASWWNQAFEAAGYRNAFQVKVMPEGADPMDVRYNVIQWVHRSTRGWSYGGSVSDPRTGEIIQGRVTLGSLRARQDYLIATGLLSPYKTGTETPTELQEFALARIRQLAAHETGHTLGFGHNYYDSSKGYISVMDYPHPRETLRPDGTIDLSQAYAVGIGDWDKVAITWGYQDFPPGTNEKAALDKIIDDAWAQDLRYLSNQDTDANPKVDQWSNGVDQGVELQRMMDVRRAALNHFGETAIKLGDPMATIEDVLVPVYLYHRYSVEAAASALGGQEYFYAMRGDGHAPFTYVPAAEQRTAIDALMRTLDPKELVIPASILKLIPPRPGGYGRYRELFPRLTGLTFDPITPAATAADLTVGFILRSQRAARLVTQHAVDPSLPGLDEVIDRLIRAGFAPTVANSYEAEVGRTVGRVVADHLMQLAGTAEMPQVRAIASWKLEQLKAQLDTMEAGGPNASSVAGASARLLSADIKRFLERPAEAVKPQATPEAPPGAPIGDAGMWWIPGSEPECSVWWIDEGKK